jgi:glycosyltransferase involved in cell wall biosynthesis
MASGTPVVASAHPSLDEASGEAAVRADPDSAEAIAGAIEQALSEGDDLVARGLEQSRRFTAHAQGEAVMRAYEAAREE